MSGYAEASYASRGHLPAPNEDLTTTHLNALLVEHLAPETIAGLRNEGASWTEADVIAAAYASAAQAPQ